MPDSITGLFSNSLHGWVQKFLPYFLAYCWWLIVHPHQLWNVHTTQKSVFNLKNILQTSDQSGFLKHVYPNSRLNLIQTSLQSHCNIKKISYNNWPPVDSTKAYWQTDLVGLGTSIKDTLWYTKLSSISFWISRIVLVFVVVVIFLHV